MEDLEKPSVKSYSIYTMANKLFLYDNHIKIETYSNEWYYGIIFMVEEEEDIFFKGPARYDVVHHYHMDWERLLINNKQGCKDLPFHQGTYRFLPEGIQVLEL